MRSEIYHGKLVPALGYPSGSMIAPMSMAPVYNWLSEVHVEVPIAGSVILAGIPLNKKFTGF